jgi:hypothetical protein
VHFTVYAEGFLALPGDAFIAELHRDSFLFVISVIFTFLGKFSIPDGVRRFGASLGRPGRRLNRSVPSGFAFLNSVKGALAAGPCLILMFT